ncbi:MAG TPA: globin domain-containing protein [Streptomyces sp.]|nr:globin domain-containing protein [Streptomyces sp.]
MTTTSAGNGPSAGDGGRGNGERDDGDWGWFTPSKPQDDGTTAEQETSQHEEDDDREIRESQPARDTRETRETRESARPSLSAIGPVSAGAGVGAVRARLADAPEESGVPAQQPPPAYGQSGPRPGPNPGPGPVSGPGPGPGPDNAGFETPREHPAPLPQPQTPGYDGGPAAAGVPPANSAESRDGMLIRRTMEEVEPYADAATAYFYALLFVQHPELRDLFPASMDSQRDRLFRALITAVRLADDPDVLSRYLSGLGRGHRKYGTRPEHYPAVGECLLGALAQYAPRTWSDETEDAWVRAYTLISQTMIDAAAEDEQHAPPWWNAQIVSHELRTSDIAVITLRPDQPYPFHAGQYTSVETPWWPRVWRHYSFASCPRPDGLLTFHVKAVPTGWVSSALVHRARPGDVVRLGPPSGSMTVDHATDSGMLCLGGGTGIAPIKAMVEDVVQHGRTRPVEIFYGARSDHDLYDLETMLRLEQQHRWLSVRPVVATGAGSAYRNVLSGQLPDAVRQYGPWSSYDGYLSGPPGMIRSGVDALVEAGVPTHRIRHDAVADLIISGE